MKRINTFFMKTGWLTSLLVVFTFGLSNAQSDNSYTLQQCIDYALKSNYNLKNTEFDEYVSKAQIKEVRGAGLPQINGAASVTENPNLRRLFINYNPATPGLFTFPSGSPGGVYASPNVITVKASGDAGVNVSQMLFNGSYLVGLKASKTVAELSHKNVMMSQIQIVENVSKAFYSLVINNERKNLLDANIARVDSLLKQTRSMNEQGFVEKIDVDRVEVTYNNLVVERTKFDQLVELTKLLLKFQMGYDVNNEIIVKGDISDVTNLITSTFTTDTTAYQNRIEYKILETQYSIEKLNLKNKHMQSAPTLTAVGSLGYYRGGNNVGGLFSKGNELPAAVSSYHDQWYRYDYVGVNLNVPIFSGLSRYYRAQQSKITLQKIENNLDAFKQSASLQVHQAEINFKNNSLTLENQKRNMNLAAEVTRVTKIKYQQGIGANLDVVTAETSHKEAQTNYYNALYDLMVSQIDYQKAMGTLYQPK
ncbi:MAG TPA: TolC family protein [Cytophagaceae bacterium]|jgi:outer membrane protein|nr:TolC family protein [Cytophagaceae bacterium]